MVGWLETMDILERLEKLRRESRDILNCRCSGEMLRPLRGRSFVMVLDGGNAMVCSCVLVVLSCSRRVVRLVSQLVGREYSRSDHGDDVEEDVL